MRIYWRPSELFFWRGPSTHMAVTILAGDRSLHPVVEDIDRRAAQRFERLHVTAQQRLQILVQDIAGEQEARVAQHRAGDESRTPCRRADGSADSPRYGINYGSVFGVLGGQLTNSSMRKGRPAKRALPSRGRRSIRPQQYGSPSSFEVAEADRRRGDYDIWFMFVADLFASYTKCGATAVKGR